MIDTKSISMENFWAKIGQLRPLLRLRPFDTASPEGRSQERHRRLALSVLASIVSKVIALAAVFISQRLTYRYLGVERYELWITMSTTIAMLSFADFGIGNGLLTMISEANGKGDERAATRAVSSAFVMLSGIAAALALVLFCVQSQIPWGRVFNVSSPAALAELGPALIVFFLCFIINIPLGLVPRIQLGYQEGFINSIWVVAGNLLGLIVLLAAIYFRAGLPWLVLALAGTPALCSCVNGFVLFGLRRPTLRPEWGSVSLPIIKALFRMGVFFFVLQVTFALAYASDNLIAKRLLPAGAVTEYSAVSRLFTLAPMLVEMFCVSLWPAYGEAIARGDVAWIRRTLTRSLLFALCFTGSAALVLILFAPALIRLWLGPGINPSFWLLLGWGLWSVLSVGGSAAASFLNGTKNIAFQVACAVLMSSVAFTLKIILAPRIGLPGVVFATVVSYATLTTLPMCFYIPRLLKRLSNSAASSPLARH